MGALQSDSDLLFAACDALNTICSRLKGRVAFRLVDGAEAPAAAIERIADLIQRAHDEAEAQSFQFALDAALENPRPVRTLELAR